MTDSTQPPPKKPPRTAKAKVRGSGASAQGKGAKAAGRRAVIVERDNKAPISTGSGDIYQTIVNQADQPGASASDLRKGYLAWLSLRANELPLFAGDSGRPAQLSCVYTALLTQGREAGEAQPHAAGDPARAMADRDGARQSALEALDAEQYLVLMGGPGSGKTTFLNFVALCMAGELLGLATANLKRLRTPIPPEPDEDTQKKPSPSAGRIRGCCRCGCCCAISRPICRPPVPPSPPTPCGASSSNNCPSCCRAMPTTCGPSCWAGAG